MYSIQRTDLTVTSKSSDPSGLCSSSSNHWPFTSPYVFVSVGVVPLDSLNSYSAGIGKNCPITTEGRSNT
jgi:hypothetical protein